MSREHAANFRLEFLNSLSENSVCDLARTALLVAAEDDSIGTFFISHDVISIHYSCNV